MELKKLIIVIGDYMKLIIYTAIFGNYDILKDPLYTNHRIRYICFTDNKELRSDIWKIILVKIEEGLTSRRQARKYKILSHKYIDNEFSLWVDGSCQVVKDPFTYIGNFLYKSPFTLSNHPRGCLYREADRCIKVHKGDKNKIIEQIERYKKEKYPENNGLVDSTVLLRRMTPEVKKIEIGWWKEIENGCVRDQVSFNYVAWKNNFKHGLFNYRKIVSRKSHRRKNE